MEKKNDKRARDLADAVRKGKEEAWRAAAYGTPITSW